MPHEDPHVPAAIATFLNQKYAEREAMICGQLPGHGRVVPREWVAVIAGTQYPLTLENAFDGYDVHIADRTYAVRADWSPGDTLLHCLLTGRPMAVQVERLPVGYRLFHGGAQVDVLVLTPNAAALNALMPVKEAPDLSKYLLSPMPGLPVSVAVSEGQEVRAGEELAVVEAMKMENILRAERDGIISTIHAKAGDSLAVDQKILEFE